MLHDTLCARCHNEVCSPFSVFSLVRALNDILMLTVHRTVNIATTPQTMSTLARSHQNSTTSSMASLRWGCSAASPRLASSYSKQKWATLSLPLPWAPDSLAYIDDTESGSRKHISLAPGFQTTKTSRHLGKVVGLNKEDEWFLPLGPVDVCVICLPPSVFLCPYSFISLLVNGLDLCTHLGSAEGFLGVWIRVHIFVPLTNLATFNKSS